MRSKISLIAVFPGLWAFYALGELAMRMIVKTQTGFFLDSLFPAAVYCLGLYTIVGAILYWLQAGIKGIKPKSIMGCALALIALDQAVKAFVRAYVPAGGNLPLLDGISITNALNVYGTWVNARFFLAIPPAALIVLNILFVLLATQGYRFARHTNRGSFWLDLCYLLLLAGSVSSLVDRVFFGGSTDFIAYRGIYNEDFKDLYLAFGIGSFLAALTERMPGRRLAGGYVWPLGRDFLRFTVEELRKARLR